MKKNLSLSQQNRRQDAKQLRAAKKKDTLPTGAWVQLWEESERGWGTRPDGCCYFMSEAEAKEGTQKFLTEMRDDEAKIYKGMTPDSYTRPTGSPKFVPVSADLAREIVKHGKDGLWDNKWPKA